MAPFDYLRNDLHLILSIDEHGDVRVQEQRDSVPFTAVLSLNSTTVEALATDYVDHPSKASEIAITLLHALEAAGVDFQAWLNADRPQVIYGSDPRYPGDPDKWTYSLLRLVLQLDASELDALPWEAITDIWAQAGHNTLVVRTVSQPPDMASTPLDLPLTILQVDESLSAAALPDPAGEYKPDGPGAAPDGEQPEPFRLETICREVFRRIEQADVDDIVRVRGAGSWEEVTKLADPSWLKVDVVHLKVADVGENWQDHQNHPVLTLRRFRDPFEREDLEPAELAQWLKAHQTRLVVLDAPSSAWFDRRAALSMARELGNEGGPAVLVTFFGEDEELRQAFFHHYYAQIIHDVPLDHACFVNWTDNGFNRPAPNRQPRWLRENSLQLIAGPGAEELLRITPVLYAAEDRRREMEYRAAQLQDQGSALAKQIRLLSVGGARDIDPGSQEPEFFGHLDIITQGLGKIRHALREMSQQMTFTPTGESRSTAPLVRNRRALESRAAELAEAQQGLRQSSIDPALDYLDQNLKRTVNTWLVEGKSVEEGRVLSAPDRLKVKTSYLLHVDVGPRTEKTQSVVVNPVELNDIVEQIFEIEDAEGVMLEVAVFSDDFWVGPAQVDPPVKPEAWRRPPAEWPQPKITWQRPAANAAVGHLWLARARPSPPLYFSLRPRRAGYGRLHLVIYYRNNLLQSLLVEARTMPGAGPDDSLEQLPGIGKAHQARLTSAGIRTLSDLAVADEGRLPAVTRAGRTRSQAWVEEARKLQELGNSAFVTYTTSADLTALRETPSRTVTILTNELRGTHFVGVKLGEWDETLGKGDDYAYGNRLTETEVKSLLEAVRSDLAAASSVLDPGTRQPVAYNFGVDNAGKSIGLARALYRLAVKGYRLYSKFFSAEAQTALTGRLQQEKQTIHLARVVGNFAIPWGIVYDQPLAYYHLETPKVVCLHALEQLGAGDCGLTGRSPQPGEQPEQALKKAAQKEDADRPGYADVEVLFYKDPAICPKAVHGANNVVCPWGFWGFKHYLEQPAQQLTTEKPEPRELRRTIPTASQARVNVNVFTGLDLWKEHVSDLKALRPGGRSLSIVDAGEDKYDAAGILQPGLYWVEEALKDPELVVIYFYCHGGSGGNPPEAFLSVGSSKSQQIRPPSLDVLNSKWPLAPLVFVNGCETVALEPSLFGTFVQKFAEHGAAGVIGTEVSVWEPLAREVAEDFLKEFLGGRPVGEILLEIRRKLLKKNNPLGLVYTNYCASDLRLEYRSSNGSRPVPAVGMADHM